jgi:hypothetical protein
MFQAKLAVPLAPVVSLAVMVTVLLPDAVGVPEIRPVSETDPRHRPAAGALVRQYAVTSGEVTAGPGAAQ